jgi:cobaltochelatase CobS
MTNETIKCEICGDDVHVIKSHLDAKHPETSYEEYQKQYPNAPLLSSTAQQRMQELKKKKEADRMSGKEIKGYKQVKKPFHEIFEIPEKVPGAMSSKGNRPIPISVFEEAPSGFEFLVPAKDPNYIFSVENTKTVLMGLECKLNVYLNGPAGTGKTTLFEQVCAYTKRAVMRVQHTVNTEESHIVGHYVVKEGETVWEPGPLQVCMRYGLTYLADEYDRGMPQVLSVYQPVLEGKDLVTKEAPPEWRYIKPHPDFRFVATGNTNGAGDETGLYPSTALQDFANFERFTLMMSITWMPEAQEVAVVQGQSGILKEDAEKLVRFAKEVRRAVEAGEISAPISPRSLIGAAKIGHNMASFSKGLEFAYMNRLTSVDREACTRFAQRIFG